MNHQVLAATANVKEHQELLLKISSFFQKVPGVMGMFVSGSTAAGGMDIYSDLDLGFLCCDEASRAKIWETRWDWDISPWFHRFDADHVKSNFVIYFFKPNIHVDLNFYVEKDLPPPAGGPYVIAWDTSGKMEAWAEKTNRISPAKPDWSHVVHEDERFWAWIHYAASHAARGEYYDTVRFLKDLRFIVETWEARLMGRKEFDSRRAEMRFSSDFISTMSQTFCVPSKKGIQEAFSALIKIQLQQRQKIGQELMVNWRVQPSSIAHIQTFAERLE